MNLDEYVYYYYPPLRPQFFFPKDNFSFFKKFYFPYSSKAKFFWWVYGSFAFFRNLFTVEEKKIPLPIHIIKNAVNTVEASYFFNLGTKGEEQKATIIAKGDNKNLFLKLGQSKMANDLIKNECKTLIKLEQSNLKSAKVLTSGVINKTYAYLVTELIDGVKFEKRDMDENVLGLLIKVSNSFDFGTEKLIKVFSHGDFCPWNILQDRDDNLVLIDWEKAGQKPLGYDLFTYIFQTNFLLYPKRNLNTIIHNNLSYIQAYFNEFNVINWREYLTEFAIIKMREEKRKSTSNMHLKYKSLLNF